MFDIDPPAPAPRLDAPRNGDGGTVLADAGPSFPAQMDAYLADRWAVLHATEPAAQQGVGAAIYHLNTLAAADGCLAPEIDRL